VRALEEASSKIAAAQSGDLAAKAKDVGGAKVLAARVQGDGKSLRELADKLREGRVEAVGLEHVGQPQQPVVGSELPSSVRRLLDAPERQQPRHQIAGAAGLPADAQERIVIQEIGFEL